MSHEIETEKEKKDKKYQKPSSALITIVKNGQVTREPFNTGSCYKIDGEYVIYFLTILYIVLIDV